MREISPQICATEVANLMTKKFSIGGAPLEVNLRRAGRHLPRFVRREAAFLVEALALAENPKLRRLVDEKRLRNSHAICIKYLNSIDESKRRRDQVLSISAGISLSILVPAGLFIWLLVERGYL